MSKFEILFNIAKEQMFCASCSLTIENTLKNYLNTKNYPYDYVGADFRKKTAEVLLEAETVAAIEPIVTGLKQALQTCGGYDCLSHEIRSAGSEELILSSVNHTQTTLAISHSHLFLIPLSIASGISLMVAEHLSWLPTPDNKVDIAINCAIGTAATLLTLLIGRENFSHSLRSLKTLKVFSGAMDNLLTLGSISAITYSFLMIARPFFLEAVQSSGTFFSVPLFVLGLIKLSHALRDRLQAKIESQIDIIANTKRKLPITVDFVAPPDAKENEDLDPEVKTETHVVTKVLPGSIISIAPNHTVPIDGILIGHRTVLVKENFFGKKGNTSKNPGIHIFAGAVNTSEKAFLLKTSCEAKNNHIRQAYASVKQTNKQNETLETVTKYFFPPVLGIALASSIGWGILGPSPSIAYAIQVFLSVIFSACPCSFGLIQIIPSIFKSLAFQQGTLLHNDHVLSIDEATDICLDKCGTLTTGKYSLIDLDVGETKSTDTDKNKLEYLSYAIVLENQIDKKKRGAVANAIIDAAHLSDRNINLEHYQCTQFTSNPLNVNRGGIAIINDKEIIVGNRPLLENQGVNVIGYWSKRESEYAEDNKLPIFLAINKQICALLILESAEESEQIIRLGTDVAIAQLLKKGKTVHILTGDTATRTNGLLEEFADNDRIRLQTECTPQNKVDYVKKLQSNGSKVIMVGDDDNDIGAIKQADFGIAIDTLAPSREQAMAVLNGSLLGLIQMMELATLHRIAYRTSIGIAFGLNSVTILIATGALYPATHTLLDPMIMGSVMALSSLLLMSSIGVFYFCGKRRLQKYAADAKKSFSLWDDKNQLGTPLLHRHSDKTVRRDSAEEQGLVPAAF